MNPENKLQTERSPGNVSFILEYALQLSGKGIFPKIRFFPEWDRWVAIGDAEPSEFEDSETFDKRSPLSLTVSESGDTLTVKQKGSGGGNEVWRLQYHGEQVGPGRLIVIHELQSPDYPESEIRIFDAEEHLPEVTDLVLNGFSPKHFFGGSEISDQHPLISLHFEVSESRIQITPVPNSHYDSRQGSLSLGAVSDKEKDAISQAWKSFDPTPWTAPLFS